MAAAGPEHEAIAAEVHPEVRDLLASIRRTEDLAFCPGGRRLAIADFGEERVVVFTVTVAGTPAAPTVSLDAALDLRADVLSRPHGIAWIDDDHVVVANRTGGVVVLKVPDLVPGTCRRHEVTVDPDLVVGSAERGLGSVAVRRCAERSEAFLCNNWENVVTRHQVVGTAAPVLDAGEPLVRRHQDLPDGVAVDPGGRWLAVSVHNQHQVLVYDLHQLGDPDALEPAGILRGAGYPHGLCFSADARHLFVADAGAPDLLRYDAPDGDWHRAAYPAVSTVVLASEVFRRGHGRHDEGGPKGVDLHPGGLVVALTCEEAPLVLLALAPLLAPADDPDPVARRAAERERRQLDTQSLARTERSRFEYLAAAAEQREHDARAEVARQVEELDLLRTHLAETQDAAAANDRWWRERHDELAAHADQLTQRLTATDAVAGEAARDLAALRSSWSWRLTAPARRMAWRIRAGRGHRPG